MSEVSNSSTPSQPQRSLFVTVFFGILLIPGVAVIAFWVTGVIGYVYSVETENGILLADGTLYVLLISFLITVTASFTYFSFHRLPRKTLILIHALVAILFLSGFVFQLIQIRKEQRLILDAYQEFRQAITAGDYEEAYNRVSPHYRKEHTVEDLKRDLSFISSFFSEGFIDVDTVFCIELRNFQNSEAYLLPDPEASFWYRPAFGLPLCFEKVNGQWFFIGQSCGYIAD